MQCVSGVSMSLVDVLILSNGPGELATWVRPVVAALRRRQPDVALRISVVLSPCTNASGQEAAMARGYSEVDRVQGPEDFFPFLLMGKTAENWDWSPQGVVLFLGGDQVYPVVIGRRLGYATVVYAEWEARWHRWVDRFGCMGSAVVEATPARYRAKCTVVGDLMVDARTDAPARQAVARTLQLTEDDWLVGLMPGSKGDKLAVGLPFALGVAEAIQAQCSQARFAIPVAPMLSLDRLVRYAQRETNPAIDLMPGSATAELVQPTDGLPYLRTANGLEVPLWQPQPAYDLMAQFRLCLTTIGANTAELGALGVPMMVLLPTQKLDAMRAWDGLPGLLANLPGVGRLFALAVNYVVLQRILQTGRRFAWPNLWAGRDVVPELIGPITPQAVADQAADYLHHPHKLQAMEADLRSIRGEAGAADALAALVWAEAGHHAPS